MAKDLRTSPASAPDAPATPPDLQAIVEAQQKEIAELKAILMATIQSQPKVSPDTLWAQNHEREMKIKEELDRVAALFQETAQNRSQWEANRRYPEGKKLYRISVGWCPELVIRADNELAARAYYDHLCGITGVRRNDAKPETTTYSVVEVTSDPEAQRVAASQWEYKAAA